MGKNGKSTKHRKTQGFLAAGLVAVALGCAFRSGVGGSVLVVGCFRSVGISCGHILGLCWPILGAMLL